MCDVRVQQVRSTWECLVVQALSENNSTIETQEGEGKSLFLLRSRYGLVFIDINAPSEANAVHGAGFTDPLIKHDGAQIKHYACALETFSPGHARCTCA